MTQCALCVCFCVFVFRYSSVHPCRHYYYRRCLHCMYIHIYTPLTSLSHTHIPLFLIHDIYMYTHALALSSYNVWGRRCLTFSPWPRWVESFWYVLCIYIMPIFRAVSALSLSLTHSLSHTHSLSYHSI